MKVTSESGDDLSDIIATTSETPVIVRQGDFLVAPLGGIYILTAPEWGRYCLINPCSGNRYMGTADTIREAIGRSHEAGRKWQLVPRKSIVSVMIGETGHSIQLQDGVHELAPPGRSYRYLHETGASRCSCKWPQIWGQWPNECMNCKKLLPNR